MTSPMEGIMLNELLMSRIGYLIVKYRNSVEALIILNNTAVEKFIELLYHIIFFLHDVLLPGMDYCYR
jgi:hypothetical protein